MALHAYGTNPQSWFSWLDERLPFAGDVLEVGAGTGALWNHVDYAGRGLRPAGAAAHRRSPTPSGASVARAK